jgi:cell division protein FtsW (lipid II flippase)
MFLVVGNRLLTALYHDSSHHLYNCVLLLADVGLVMLYRLNSELALKQLIWNVVGLVCLAVVPFILARSRRLDRYRVLYIAISFALLIATLIFGRASHGSKNWIQFGGIGFQPSEIIKLLYVLYIAATFGERPRFAKVVVTTIISGAVVIFLVVQKDLGSALIFFMTYLVMLFIATGNYLYFIGGIGGLSLASVIAYRLFSHIRVRVAAWRNPWEDIGDTGYQIAQSLFAICTWGSLGIGLTRGYATSIPVVEQDFIFAAICEEFGVLFGACLILVFVLIFLEGARGALENHNRFLTMLCAGLTALIAFQSFLIIGGVIKLIPLTGVTLPFVSYGGTSIVVSYLITAIIQWIITRNTRYAADKAAEETDNRERHSQVHRVEGR